MPVDKELCNLCGTCKAVCPADAISFDRYSVVVDEGKCRRCGACTNVCPGIHVDFKELSKKAFGKWENNWHGQVLEAYIGSSTRNEILERGTSGGVVSSLLIHALETGKIDGAIVLGTSEAMPWAPEGKIVTSKEDVLNAAGSKYVLAPLNHLLKEVGPKKKIALVGLPCHIHGLRNLEAAGFKELTEKVVFTIGIFCGINRMYAGIPFLLRHLGVKKLEEVGTFRFRAGGRPQMCCVRLKNGTVLSEEASKSNYLYPLFTPVRCTYCIDALNELADISVGDAWLPEFSRATCAYGRAIILARTHAGKRLIEAAGKAKILELNAIGKTDCIRAQLGQLNYKKIGAFVRMTLSRKIGRNVPDYGLSMPNGPIAVAGYGLRIYPCDSLGAARYVLEWFYQKSRDIMMRPLARRLVSCLPNPLINKSEIFFSRMYSWPVVRQR